MWEKRSPPSGVNGKGIHLEAMLVESYQDNGSVKQRRIEYLGSIREKFLTSKVCNMREFHKGLFWTTVDKKLDHLRLTPSLRKQVEDDISHMVSRPQKDWELWGVTCIPRFDP